MHTSLYGVGPQIRIYFIVMPHEHYVHSFN